MKFAFFQSSRPADPTTLDFELNEEFIDTVHDGFLKGDISVGQRRHLIFATDAQLQLLGNWNYSSKLFNYKWKWRIWFFPNLI